MKRMLGYISLSMLLVSCFSPLLEVDRRAIANIPVPGKDYKIVIYYISGNATVQNCMQVVASSKDKGEHVLENYERYNTLESYRLVADSSLMLVVGDSISYLGSKSKPDTIFLPLKQID
ncbi:hypothetical protein [Chitinophaga varians]|uniref:hypothetical protein n=1 Tax=Chitinophaga varians TaxID=2202339 RepID=UPI00165F0FF9|nr:hypothetical protein [Chitinophaga varians]MBC9914601.1 hypothetical protein [Chitinophaga varians]